MSKFVGTVKISKDVLINIAGKSAYDVDGVTEVVGFNPNNLSANRYNPDAKGVCLDFYEDMLVFEMEIIAEKNKQIPRITREVQEEIVENIYAMTGLEVLKVDITVVKIV